MLQKTIGELKEYAVTHDWLLIYWYKGADLILERTGTHSDLFKKKKQT